MGVTPPVPNSTYLYAVGNPNTNTFRYVEVTTYRDGEVPMGVYPAPVPAESVALVNPGSESGIEATSAMYSDVLFSAASVGPSPQEMQMFASNVKFALEDAVAPSPGTGEGFESFASADMLLVSNYLWAFKTALDPNWQGENVGLLDALKLARGKGPTACIVYRNGDSACYQLSPVDKNAARYINGTARSLSGALIDDTQVGGGGIGGGEPLSIVQTNTNEYRWTNGSGSTGWLWLVCSRQGGEITSCYYIVIPLE